MIRAVAFDLDNTLVRSNTDFHKMRAKIRHYIHRFINGLGEINGSRTTIELVDIVERNPCLKDRRRHVKRIHDIMDRIELESAWTAVPMDGAASCLSQLKGMGLMIGVLTRACPAYTRIVLRKTDLMDLVDVYVSRVPGKPVKPDPRSLELLASNLGVSIGELLLVGDHRSDAECAKLAEVPFVQLASSKNAEPLPAAARICSLAELPLTVRHLCNRHL